MKQVVQNYKSGELAVLDVPVPGCKPGGVLVRSAYSLISTGTELMKVSEAGMSMLGKARSRPDQVAKVMQSVATNGVPATYRKVMGKLDSYTPLGYSLCGVVEQVGAGIDDVKAGDLVACAGNEHALHAELNWVPKNLYTPVPDGLAPRHAAFGTVGSIALQGVRQGESKLGEVALVIGLGLIGQLVVQLLAASGVRVVGADPDPERCELAERLGAAACGDPASPAVEAAVAELTGGLGVDQVYLAAGGGSNQPVELAARLCRDRGRVVDIGKCRLDLPWNAYYEKELDVRFSRSYGPGRYDPEYELEGRDYPIGYVRWTERRNLACFLDLLARGSVDVEPLVSRIADFDDAVETYQSLKSGELKAVAVLFRYPGHAGEADAPAVAVPAVKRPVGAVPGPARAARTPVRLAFVGAGNYATSMLLPHLAQRDGVELSTVVTTTALSAANAQRKFGFAEATTDLDAVLGDKSIDAVFVVTRHSSHAELTRKALLAGKTVFVEKPWPSPRTNWPACSRQSRSPATTGCRWASTAGSRRCCGRPGSGSAPGAVLRACGTWSTRAGCSTAAGTSGRAPRARGSPARAGTSSTRRAGCSMPTRIRCTRSPRPATRICRSYCATRTGPPPPSATSPPARQASPRRRWTWSRTAVRSGSTTSSAPLFTTAAASGSVHGCRRPGTRARTPSWPRSSRPCGPAGRCRCRWSRWSPPRRPPSPCRAAWSPARR